MKNFTLDSHNVETKFLEFVETFINQGKEFLKNFGLY